jgi:hypothetical protein
LRPSKVRERDPKPGGGMGAPDGLRMRAGVQPEEVRHARGEELTVQAEVLGAEARVAAAGVAGEERRLPLELW